MKVINAEPLRLVEVRFGNENLLAVHILQRFVGEVYQKLLDIIAHETLEA